MEIFRFFSYHSSFPRVFGNIFKSTISVVSKLQTDVRSTHEKTADRISQVSELSF